MPDPKKFNPNDHLTNLGKGQYLEVRWRIVWLRQEYPEATISTELAEHNRDEKYAIVKATVTLPTGASATGYSLTEPTSIAKDYIANGETSAIGRALGALGFGTQFAPEFDQGEQVADSPVEPRRSIANPTTTATSSTRRPPPQVKTQTGDIRPPAGDLYDAMQACTAALKRARERGDTWSQSDIDTMTEALWKVRGAKNMSREQLERLTDVFDGRLRYEVNLHSNMAMLVPNEPPDGLLSVDERPFEAAFPRRDED